MLDEVLIQLDINIEDEDIINFYKISDYVIPHLTYDKKVKRYLSDDVEDSVLEDRISTYNDNASF